MSDYADISDGLLDMAREDRLDEWEEAHPDDVKAAEHLDRPLIEIVWDAAWTAAVDAYEDLHGMPGVTS